MPDSRTVVLESEEIIKKLIDAKGKPAPAPWADDWKSVAGGTFSLVLPDVKGKLGKLSSDESKDELTAEVVKSLGVIAGKTNRAAVGVDVGTGCSITVRLACGSAADAADVDAGCQALAKVAKIALDADGESSTPLDKAGHRFSTMLVRGIEFGKTVDHVVEVRMKAETGMSELLKALGSK
jgi:hypothetical protein